MRFVQLVHLVAASALVAGCGDDGLSINANASNFCGQIADVACHNLYQCCTEGEIEGYLNVSDPRTEAQCRDDLNRSCERTTATVQDSLKAKRVTFDAKRMNDCLNALVAPGGTCSEVVSEVPWKTACMDSAFVGTVTPGDSCFFDVDCQGAPDAFCAPDQRCEQKPMGGFPCGSGCASGFFCSSGFCQARVAEGGPCMSTPQCDKELFCDLNAMPSPVCKAAQQGGAACTQSEDCQSGSCIPGQCQGSSQQCYQDTDCNAHCADTGSFCTTSANCALGNCSVGGNSCSADTSCTAGSGDHCVFPVQCVPGDCIGDPVCTSEVLTVDYCTALSSLPVL